MAVKNCCIKSCQSCSTRAEDVGVTYHKYPKDEKLLAVWINVTQHKSSESPSYVCSRHFRKTDFQLFKDSKYILKSGAVPSIFPWSIATNMETSKESNKMDVDNTSVEIFNENTDVEEKTTEHNSSNKSENLETIKSFIEQETGNEGIVEISENPKDVLSSSEEKNEEKDNVDKSAERMDEGKDNCSNETKETREETVAVATSVMDMILSESESKIAKKTDCKITACKPSIPAAVKGHNSVSLSVGSKVEAKDFAEYWHPAEIMEVDYEEMEVLVHYENALKKHDEWISVSSPRLRPLGSGSATSAKPSTPAPQEDEMTSSAQVKEEPKTEEKTRPVFAVGERCLARWRDNRRFIATVTADLGDGKYDIVFDDGARWSCTTTRLYKLKEPNKNDPLTVDTGSPSVASTPSPDLVPKPVTGQLIYNTHLFDPTRDYLGSKSERREMKRKINIKEIFNIGQKKKKIKEEVPEMKSQKQVKVKKETPRRPPILRRKVETSVKAEVKKEVPDAVASIIGTLSNEEIPKDQYSTEVKKEVKEESKCEISQSFELSTIKSETLSAPETQDIKMEVDPKVLEEETKLEKFEMPSDDAHVEVIDRIKEVINKLEDGINKADDKINSIEPPKPTIKEEETMEHDTDTHPKTEPIAEPSDVKHESKQSKVKKGKKLRLLQEKQVKQQVEKVKSELEEMKRQMEEIKKQMLEKTEEMSMSKSGSGMEMPESFLLPGEWCCKWVNGQPVGKVSEIENEVKVDANNKPVLPRRSVQVEDKRLPPGWTKHMVRRSFGHSAGKWDVVLISPGNRRFHTKTDMRNYLENNPREVEALQPYVDALLDFGVHLKLSRRMGWYTVTPDGVQESPMPLPAGILSCTSPLVKRKSLSLKKRSIEKKDKKKKKRKLKIQLSRSYPMGGVPGDAQPPPEEEPMEPQPPLEDGYVYVGSLKVQVNGTLLRCPAEGCLKNFRNNTLLKMHITHYHRELRKMLGATPKVLDLAFARTRPNAMDAMKLKLEAETKTLKVKLPRLPKRLTEPKQETVKAQQISTPQCEVKLETVTPLKQENDKPLKQLDSPKLRTALTNKPVKRPKVLLPVRRLEPIETEEVNSENSNEFLEPKVEVPIEPLEPLDFETAISTHTVTKPSDLLKRKGDRKRKTFASISSKKNFSEDEEWFATNNSDMETRSSYGPRSGTPDSKTMDLKTSSELNDEDKVPNYMYTETGERIKIVHMKREEIINCHCGFREEDGLMVQCELCLCWQHALCHNIHKEADVPEKYTCSICLNPRRGRRSQRFLHDQDRLYEGLLPGAKPCESLRRSHELSGNLIRIEDALHALRVKYYVATKKDHPKLYLWAKDWETSDSSLTQDRLNSDYSDLSIMISGVGKENLPVRDDARDINVDMRTPPSSEAQEGERYSQRDNQLGSQSLLSGLLSSPGGASLDLPLSTSEFEKIAKSVQEQEVQRVIAPQPEAAIENSACRERLLRHIQRCQALIDARLDSIEAQVAELESQDPSFEDDETADYFPRTKQTIQMLMRDLETMEELGVIT